MSNTNYLKKKLTMIKGEETWYSREGGGTFMSNTNYIEKIFNNDKRRREMVVGKVVAH